MREGWFTNDGTRKGPPAMIAGMRVHVELRNGYRTDTMSYTGKHEPRGWLSDEMQWIHTRHKSLRPFDVVFYKPI